MAKFDKRHHKKVVCIGAGLTSLTFARLFAEKLGVPVTIFEQRDHIGGNAYSEIDKNSGIDVHKYGSHIFHTNNKRVWDFVNRFSAFTSYRHKVIVMSDGKPFSFPINLLTLNQVFGEPYSPDKAKQLFSSFSDLSKPASTFEEKALQTIGAELYSRFFRGYTSKQWGTNPKLLPAEIFSRIPVRTTYDDAYFSDKYQGVPTGSYGELAEAIADHPLIDVRFGVKWSIEQMDPSLFYIYTGPVDELFRYKNGSLTWRGVQFKFEYLTSSDFQGTSVVNYVDEDVPFTRIHEFKHFKASSETVGTVISREYPIAPGESGGEPAYPVRLATDMELLSLYNQELQGLPNLISAGRLGTYRYLDMHMAIGAAMKTFEEISESSSDLVM